MTDLVSNSGMTVPSTAVSGVRIEPMEKAVSSTWMAIYTTAIGLMTKQTAEALTNMSTARSMKECGKMIFNMDTESRRGQTDRVTKENMPSVESMELVLTCGTTDQNTQDTGTRTRSRGLEFILGSTVVSIKVNGSTTTWKV